MNKDKLADLTDKMIEQLLSPDEAQELAAMLEESAEARSFYFELCETHALLEDCHGKFILPESSDLPQTSKGPKSSFLLVVPAIIAAAAILLISFFINSSQPAASFEEITQLALKPLRGKALATLERSIGTKFEYGNTSAQQPKTGDDVQQGSYHLSQGIIQLNYKNGVQTIIEAPARFSLISDQLTICQNGKISAFVPAEAKGFTVRTSVADLIDLGTEFSVWVNDNDFVEVHVFKGRILVDLAPVNIAKKIDLRDNDALRIIYEENELGTKENISVNEIDLRTGFFIRNLTEPSTAYSKLITSLKPVLYFPMEMSKDGSVLNDRSAYKNDASANGIAHKKNLLTPGRVGNALHLSGANHQGYLYVADYPKAQFGELTVSAWLHAKTRPRWATIVKNWGKTKWGQFHFGLNRQGRLDVEVMTLDYKKIHIHESHKFPLNSWQHVAFVHNGFEVKLYRNGLEVASLPVNGINMKGAFKSLGIGTKIGDKDTGDASESSPGHWDGSLDEIAIFNYALSAEQIEQLYQVEQ